MLSDNNKCDWFKGKKFLLKFLLDKSHFITGEHGVNGSYPLLGFLHTAPYGNGFFADFIQMTVKALYGGDFFFPQEIQCYLHFIVVCNSAFEFPSGIPVGTLPAPQFQISE